MQGIIYLQLIESCATTYNNKSHVTIQYGDITLTRSVSPNHAKIIKVGQFISKDHALACDIVTVGSVKFQSNGTLFHITTHVGTGRKSVETGVEATKNPDQIEWCEPVVLKGIWKADLYDGAGSFLIEEVIPTK